MKLHEEFAYLKSYLSEETISQWDEQNIMTDMCWGEVFSSLKLNSLLYKNILKLVEAVLCLFNAYILLKI